MIEISVDKMSISVKGHAGQATAGNDLPCAGASVLLYALAETLEEHRKDMELLDIRLNSGDGYVRAMPKEHVEAFTLAVFEMAVNGYRQLEQLYPDFVKTKQRGCK